MWTPCSSSCGLGIKLRSRILEANWNAVGEDQDEDEGSLEVCKVQQATCIAEIPSCNFTKVEALGKKIISTFTVKAKHT